MIDLDQEFVDRAAPPGSMRYFALLYTPSDQRALVTSLFVIESEIRASVQAAHEVAHTRLQWWRGEIDRLTNGNAQHPATKVLQKALAEADFSRLHEFLVAADMDLARMTYQTRSELDAYLERSGGTLFSLIDRSETTVSIGALIRRAETLRDTIQDARAGRVYWPLDELERRGIKPEDFSRKEPSAQVRLLIAEEAERVRNPLRSRPTSVTAINILAALHERLLKQIVRSNSDVFTQRQELRSLSKVWTAWRTARRSLRAHRSATPV